MRPISLPALVALSAVVVLACGGGKGADAPNAASPERQSDAEYDVARDYFYKGQPRVALDHALKATSLNEDNAKALLFTSELYLSFCAGSRGLDSPDCRLAEAERYARLAIKADGELRDAKNTLGAILINEKKYKDAEAILEPLTKDIAYGANYLAWGNLGWAQVLDGKVDDGIVSLRNAITQPKFCVGHYRLGVAYEKKGDLAQAETSYTNALQVDSPECTSLQDAWEARGRVRLKLGRNDEARADFQKCREISVETSTGKSCAQVLVAQQQK